MDLRALRLNCLLAAVLPTVVALGVLVAAWQVGVRAQERQDLAEARAQLQAWARGGGEPMALATADTRWVTVAVLHLAGDRVVVEAGTATDLAGEPGPELVQVVHQPQAWSLEDGFLAAAARLPGTEGDSRILYAERRMVAPEATKFWVIGGCMLVLGALLGWYLARRIYRPVEWLTHEADNALHGRPAGADRQESEETQALRSSIIELADRYRSSSSSRHG